MCGAVQFSHYKIVNYTIPCGMVHCDGMVQLCHLGTILVCFLRSMRFGEHPFVYICSSRNFETIFSLRKIANKIMGNGGF